ncbi:MAG: hypothetical protein IJT57_04780 [Selenomonadaceae bacterium]|nr:hypothetical protein [Selenomonadaceae bacterium]MBQ7723619.1 hypothetical protein [Selenomonadaceae bacterium]
MIDLQKIRIDQKNRERAIENLREQIRREEHKLILLDRSIEKIRQDIQELKETINYLRYKFLKP